MIAFPRGGWQVTIADLSLILFMVSLAALADQPDAAEGAGPAGAIENPLPAMGEPVAIYRPGAHMPGIGTWLADQAPDPRQQLTVIARYSGEDATEAAISALTLADDARGAGHAARIVLEPAALADLVAVLGYDDADGGEWHDDCLEPRKRGADAASERNGPCE